MYLIVFQVISNTSIFPGFQIILFIVSPILIGLFYLVVIGAKRLNVQQIVYLALAVIALFTFVWPVWAAWLGVFLD